jgi:hypothetical protein
MGVQMRLVEALVAADPNAEGEAETGLEQPDQNEPAVDVSHWPSSPSIYDPDMSLG